MVKGKEGTADISLYNDEIEKTKSAVPEKKSKVKAKVYSIVKNSLLAVDGEGQHYRVLISDKTKNVKEGDTISI